ncbi:DinB family protein [Chloroflexota bacterium]
MTQTSKPSGRFMKIKDELADVRQKFNWLLYQIPDGDWDLKLPGEAWTAKEEMMHIVQALEVLPKGINKAVGKSSRSILSFIPSELRGRVNGYIIIPLRSIGATKKSIADAYDQAYNAITKILANLPEDAWDKGAAYPRQYRTVEQMAHRPMEHFEEHSAHLCSVLGIK